MNLTIGSGDIKSLMSGKDTKEFYSLFIKFLSNEEPRYNALASPIDACRTGAILEKRYLDLLPDNYFTQYKAKSIEMDVFESTLDFAKIEGGKIVDFDELKTMYLPDFIEYIEPYRDAEAEEYTPYIKKKYKHYYRQINIQMYCSGLERANLVFLAVNSYDDKENYNREIKENECIKFRLKRDDETLSKILERGRIFQTIKNYFNGI